MIKPKIQIKPKITAEWPWDVQLAFRTAYEIHRVIGNNIESYRKHTQRDVLKLIHAAAKRNKYDSKN